LAIKTTIIRIVKSYVPGKVIIPIRGTAPSPIVKASSKSPVIVSPVVVSPVVKTNTKIVVPVRS
jgi:hypothetical protein